MSRPPEPTRSDAGECRCGASLWRMVLDLRVWRDGTDVEACLACGHVRAVHVYWDSRTDPHQSVVRGYADAGVPEEVLGWLGAWPRLVRTGPYEYDADVRPVPSSERRMALDEAGPYWLPAATRAASEAEVVACEDGAREAQQGWQALSRLASAGPPRTPPPPALPEELAGFRVAAWLLASSDAAVGSAVAAGTVEARDHVAALVHEVAARQAWAERLAAALEAGGADRDGALREVAAAGERRTTYRGRLVRLVGPPPSLLPLVADLPPSPLRDEALAALRAVAG